MAAIKATLTEEEIQGLFPGGREVGQLLEQVQNRELEAEIADHLGAEPHKGPLPTRVGTLHLRVPQARDGTFLTELFQPY